MTPATAVAPDLAAEVAALQGELQGLRQKMEAQHKVVSDLEAESAGIASQIAGGILKPQEATAHRQKLEEQKTKLAGFDNLITDCEQGLAPKRAELNRQKTAAASAAEFEEIKNLEREGNAILDTLTERLAATVGGQVAKLSEIRRRLGKIMDAAARTGTFPIPPTAIAARTARGALDRQLAGVLEPVQKMLR